MKRFRSISRTKKLVAAGATVALTLGIAGAAFAFFTASGSGTSNATVGTAGSWAVVVAARSGRPLYPGSGTETVTYTVQNNSAGNVYLQGTTAILNTDGSGQVWNTNTASYVAGYYVVVHREQHEPDGDRGRWRRLSLGVGDHHLERVGHQPGRLSGCRPAGDRQRHLTRERGGGLVPPLPQL